MRKHKLLVVALAALGATASLQAQGFPTDFDADGRSDLTIYTSGEGGVSFSYLSSLTGVISKVNTIGTEADKPALADWFGTGGTQIAVVSLDESDGTLFWKAVDPSSGQSVLRQFGVIKDKGRDLAISGGDYNNNGYADAALAQLKKGEIQWSIAFDLFAPSGAGDQRSVSITFGKSGDRVFFANPDGAGDWLGIVRAAGKASSSIRLHNVISGEERALGTYPGFMSALPRPRPQALKTSSGADVLLVSRERSQYRTVYIESLTGDTLASFDLAEKGRVVVGDFLADPGEEFAAYSGLGTRIINPFTGVVVDTGRAGGELVDTVNFSTFGKAGALPSDAGGTKGGGGSKPGNGGGDVTPIDGPSEVSSCARVAAWPGSHIYKTVGSHHFTDVRRNTIGVVVKPGGQGPFPSCVRAVDTGGKVIASLGAYIPAGPGWQARYYAGIGCGSGTPLNGSAVAAKARASSGSSRIYLNFGSVCYGPIEASQCVGSKSC